MWNWTLKTAATKDPVDIATAKRQCRIEDEVSADDALLRVYLKAATAWVESYTGRSLMSQTWQLSLEDFPEEVYLPHGAPNAAIVSVKYYDTSNALQTLSSSVYQLVSFSEPACLTLVDGQVWPATYDRDDAVIVEYTAGATSAETVPAPLQQAVLLLVGHWYEHREQSVAGTIISNIPMAAESLCAPYRLFLQPPEWD